MYILESTFNRQQAYNIAKHAVRGMQHVAGKYTEVGKCRVDEVFALITMNFQPKVLLAEPQLKIVFSVIHI